MRLSKKALFILLLLLAKANFAQTSPCEPQSCDVAPPQLDRRLDNGALEPDGTLSSKPVPEVVETKAAPLRQPPKAPRPSACSADQCLPLKDEPKTEFQKFVFTTTGQQLNVFAADFFENVPSTFAPVDRIPVPANYVLGPGDELVISVWGQVQFNARVTVDRNGQVYLPKVGTVTVAGLHYDELPSALKNTLGRVFKNFELNVTLGQLRSIQIYVVGQARHPGSYTVSSLSTLVNALFAAGGPNANGSMRHIQLKRQNQSVTEFDLYTLLSKGDNSKDSVLLPGDVIYIPPVGARVALMGSVSIPAIYEITGDTTLDKQLDTAGGLSAIADGTRVIIERIDNRKNRTVREFHLDQNGLNESLHDGDVIHIFAISPRVEGAVTLRGNVATPGRFPWHETMRISDLIVSRQALIPRAHWMRDSLFSRNENGWFDPQAKKDPVGASRIPSDVASQQAYVKEEQDLRSKDKWSDGPLSRERTEVERYPEINWDYAVIQRLNPDDLSLQIVSFNLGRAISDHGSEDNKLLQAGDVVTIFSQTDVDVPNEKRTKLVRIEGEVKAAGIYRVESGETLRDVVRRAGGLTANAFLFAADFRRVSTREDQQKRLDQAVDEMQKQLQSRSAALLNSTNTSEEESLSAKEQIHAEQQILDRLRGTRATGRIVLDLKPEDTNVERLPAIALEDGDSIDIPQRPATVSVVGSVYNQSSFLFRSGASLGDYVRYAGGPTREADRDRTFVIRADGSVVSAQMHRSIWSGAFESLKLEPGDTAVVPERIKTGSVLKSLRDWSQVFAQFAIGAAAIQVLRQ